MKKTIVVLDGVTLNPGDNPWDDLERLGEVRVYEQTAPDQVIARAKGAEVVLTNKTRLTGELLEQLPELGFVGVLATGYDVVDVAAARRLGVVVSNAPRYGDSAVAQHTMALLLTLAHQVEAHDEDIRAGAWASHGHFCYWRAPPLELTGLTMGIVGVGHIGRRVGALASAFGMSVLGWGGRGRGEPEFEPFAWAGSLEELLERADVVSLHCPLTEESREMIDAAALQRMKRQALLINTARGGLIDEEALASALERGVIGGAALDVLSTEPPSPDNPLLGAPRCRVTGHMAWGSLKARRRLMEITVENVRAYLDGAPVHVVGGG